MLTHDVDERNRIIGENLRKYRLLKGLTQDELAEGICSISQLSKIENGKTYVKRSLLKLMAERLSVTVERIESIDAMQEELTENLQLAKDALTANNIDKSIELVSYVIEKSREFGYQEHLIEGILLQCRLYMTQERYKEVIEVGKRAMEEEIYQDSSQKVRLLAEVGYAYQLSGNMMAAYDYYTRADEEFDQTTGNVETQLRIFFELARCNGLMQNHRTALRYLERAEKLATEKMVHLRRIRATYMKAGYLDQLGESEKAEKIYISTLKEAEDNSFLSDVAIIHNNIGCLYQSRGDYGQALAHFYRAQKLFELLNEHHFLTETLLHLAEISLDESEYDKAEDYVQQVLVICENVGRPRYREKAKALRILGEIRDSLDMFEEYVTFLETALQIYEENHVMIEAYEVATELAEALYQRKDSRALDMYRLAIEYNNRNKKFGLRR